MARPALRMWAGLAAATLLAAPFALAQSPGGIESGSLAELDPWAVGGMGRNETALPRTLWRQSDPVALTALFDRIPVAPGSPAAARLFRQALLSPSDAPPGDALLAARKRYETLARLGAADELVSMVSGSGEAKRDPGIALYATQATPAAPRNTMPGCGLRLMAGPLRLRRLTFATPRAVAMQQD